MSPDPASPARVGAADPADASASAGESFADSAASPLGAPGSRNKAPRRTAERILDVTLALFNRYGEPNVSTNMIAAELSISPGNLYYHYPAKEALINALVDRFEAAMLQALSDGSAACGCGAAITFTRALFQQIWHYRFIYRDLNDLLTRNRQFEQRYARLRDQQHRALVALLERLHRGGALPQRSTPAQQDELATTLLLILSYWLCYEYACNPRSALEPDNEDAAIGHGMAQIEGLLGCTPAP